VIMKTYSNASNARRAAKAAGLVGFTLVKSGIGFAIHVAAPEPAPVRKATAPKAPKVAKVAKAPAKKAPVSKAPKAPDGETKIAQLTRLCSGATISELMETLGWRAHTTRGAISRLHSDWGFTVTRTKVGAEAHYKIAS
jgi:Protein of unknown function (DUF3489)